MDVFRLRREAEVAEAPEAVANAATDKTTGVSLSANTSSIGSTTDATSKTGIDKLEQQVMEQIQKRK